MTEQTTIHQAVQYANAFTEIRRTLRVLGLSSEAFDQALDSGEDAIIRLLSVTPTPPTAPAAAAAVVVQPSRYGQRCQVFRYGAWYEGTVEDVKKVRCLVKYETRSGEIKRQWFPLYSVDLAAEAA